MAHRRNVLIAFGSAVVGQGVAALAPVLQRVVIDDAIVGRTRPVAPWLVALGATALFVFGCSYLRRWVGGRVSLDVQYDLRVAVFERLQRLDFAGHDELQTGQLVSRSSSDLGLIQGLLAFLPIIVGNVVLLVVALVVMVVLSPLLTVVMLVMLPVLMVVTLRMRQWVFPATWDAQQRAGAVAGIVDEAVSGVRVVKGFGQEDREIRRLAEGAESLFAARSRLIRLTARYTPALQAIPAFAQVGVLALGGWLAIEGHITVGTFLAFSSYLVQLVAPVRMLASLFAIGQQARAGAERLLDVLDATAAVVDHPGAVPLPPVRGAIAFEDVTFGYDRNEPVLDGFELHLDPGEVVAIVGVSGSGKSTVAALVARFYDVGGGRVTIDGVDVRDVTLDSLRRQVGVVFEDAFLFSDSVRDNIAYAVPGATDADVVAAATAAGAHEFIGRLPQGYDTLVGERGLTLSGGQRQRVALARAILADSRILVLDDATSSIDAMTEESIHSTLRSLMVDRTTILIAHRRSTLRLAHRVVVVEAGRVVEEGTDAELTARSERYRQLLAGESGAVADDDPDVDPDDAGLDDAGLDDTDAVDADSAAARARAWPDVPVDVSGPFRSAGPQIGAPGGGGTMSMALAATPDLLERLERLPPADDVAGTDLAVATAPQRGPFRFLAFIRPWRRALALGFGLVALDSLLTLLGPWFVRRGLDHGVDARDTGALWWASAAFAVTVGLDWIVTRGFTLVTGRTAERALCALRVKIFAHLQRMSLDYYDAEMDGRIMTRMTTDVEALSQVIQTGVVSAVVAGVTCVGVAGFLVVLSPPLALAAAVVLPPLGLATWAYRRRSSVAYGLAREAIADVNANLQENLSGVRVAQASVREDRNLVGYREVNQRYLDHRLGAQRLIALYFPFVLLLGDLAAVSVLATGSALVHRGTITTAVVIAFLLYLDQFFSPIQQLSQVLDTWQQASASLVKIEELLSTPTGTPEADAPTVLGALTGAIALDDVHFRYPTAAGAEAIAGVDLKFEPGATVALVGSTGAGKSTLLKLIARFYDPGSGAVSVDGVDLREVDLSSYRRQLGIVPQEAFLFAATVRDNIAYGRPDATDAEVEAAARAVGAHRFVASLPHGYREPISERGRSLSSGQRQLLALARARLVDPPILLLDEATSNLDLHSEARVQAAMRSAAAGRTTVLVAHRLQTARHADRIVVVEGGRVVQDGTHDRLLAEPGRYRDLWSSYDGASR